MIKLHRLWHVQKYKSPDLPRPPSAKKQSKFGKRLDTFGAVVTALQMTGMNENQKILGSYPGLTLNESE